MIAKLKNSLVNLLDLTFQNNYWLQSFGAVVKERINMTTQEKIAVMQAAVDGKKIEYRWQDDLNGDWIEITGSTKFVVWNWEAFIFRVKPEPSEFWINVYADRTLPIHLYETKEKALLGSRSNKLKTIRVREVIDN